MATFQALAEELVRALHAAQATQEALTHGPDGAFEAERSIGRVFMVLERARTRTEEMQRGGQNTSTGEQRQHRHDADLHAEVAAIVFDAEQREVIGTSEQALALAESALAHVTQEWLENEFGDELPVIVQALQDYIEGLESRIKDEGGAA